MKPDLAGSPGTESWDGQGPDGGVEAAKVDSLSVLMGRVSMSSRRPMRHPCSRADTSIRSYGVATLPLFLPKQTGEKVRTDEQRPSNP